MTYGAARIPQLDLSLALLAFADDMNIFTDPQCISAWLSLLYNWGSLSGVTLNIPKCLLNFWSCVPNAKKNFRSTNFTDYPPMQSIP